MDGEIAVRLRWVRMYHETSNHPPPEDAIEQRIEEGQFDYNWRRPHGSLGGKAPVDRIAEEAERAYGETKEQIRHREWRVDKTLADHHATKTAR